MVRFREIPHISFSRDKGIAQVRGQLPHKSGDKPLPCAIFVVPLHRIRMRSDGAPVGNYSPMRSDEDSLRRLKGVQKYSHPMHNTF